MLSIELYQHHSTQEHFFRLVYNGQVLLLPGCPSSLCGIHHLLSALAFGRDGHLPACYQTTDRVDPVAKTNRSDEEAVSGYETVLFTTGEWMLLTTALSIMSSLFGALLYMAAAKQTDGPHGGSPPNRSAIRRTLTHFAPALGEGTRVAGAGGRVAYDPVPVHEQL
jgi:hypothetical protein